MLQRGVIRKADLSEKVQTQKCEDDNPDCKIDFPVQKTPVVGLVGNAQELESKSHFNESQHYLHGVQP